MKKGLISLTGTTPGTLTLARPAKEVILSNAGTAVVYGVVNWVTGDTEVSASNLHFLVKAGDTLRIGFPELVAERISTLRLLSASAAVVGYLSE